MILNANCKVNIGLNILYRRDDGFHELETLIYPVKALYDVVEVERTMQPGLHFRSCGLLIDCPDEQNLSLKAARLMQRYFDIDGVEITLDKRVPFGAGLGGGSSDATTVLLAINELFELQLSEQRLISLAAELGSDTPFFVRNRPQICRGRGEIMSDYSLDLSGYKIVLVKPDGVNISTKEAYSSLDISPTSSSLVDLLQLPIEQWQGVVVNDFERSLFAQYPQLKSIKDGLIADGALYAAMSGSGSTIFGIFNASAETHGYVSYDL